MNITKALEVMSSSVDRVKAGSGHKYINKLNGTQLAGVTTISGMAGFKEAQMWMPAWGGKEAVSDLGYFDRIKGRDHKEELDELANTLEEIKSLSPGEYLELLTQAKSAHARKSRGATDLGKLWHDYLESYLKSIINGGTLPEFPSDNEFIINAVKGFFEWASDNVDDWIASEALVADLNNEYAGTLDALAVVKGSPAVIDFKFADNKSITWDLQTAGYAKPFSDYGIDIKDRYIIRFPKSELLKQWNAKERCYEEKPNQLEIIECSKENLDWEYKVFLNYRLAEKWVNYKVKK